MVSGDQDPVERKCKAVAIVQNVASRDGPRELKLSHPAKAQAAAYAALRADVWDGLFTDPAQANVVQATVPRIDIRRHKI